MATVYIAAAMPVSPFICAYKFDGATFTKLADPSVLPTGVGAGGAISPNGRYVAVAHTTSPYVTIYKRDDSDVLTKLANPATLPTGDGVGCSFSPSGDYLAVAHAASPYMTVYARNGDTFTKLSNPASLPSGAAAAGFGHTVRFSNNGRFIVITAPSTPFLEIYELAGATLTKLSAVTQPGGLPNRQIGWIGDDDTYLALGAVSSPYVDIYKRSGTTFTKQSNPATLPLGDAKFARTRYRADDGTKYHLYFTHGATANGIGEYQLNPGTDTFTRNASFPFVDTEPNGTVVGAPDVSFQMDLLACNSNATPFVYFYDLTNPVAPVKYADPASLPASSTGPLEISQRGNVIQSTTAGATANFDGASYFGTLASTTDPAVADFDGAFEISYINAFTQDDVADFDGASDFGTMAGVAGPAVADFDGASNFGTLAGIAGPALMDFNLVAQPTEFIAASVVLTAPTTLEAIFPLFETINLSSEDSVEQISVLIEQLLLDETGVTQLSGLNLLVQTLGLEETAVVILVLLVVEQLALADTVTGERQVLANLVDTLIANGQVTGQAQAVNLIAAAMALQDLAAANFADESVVDSAVFAAAVAANVGAINNLLSAVVLTSTSTLGLVLTGLSTENLSLLTSPVGQLTATDLIAEFLALNPLLMIDGAPYHAWVMNTEENMPISHYPDYPFSSMARIGSRYLGTSESGLYTLDGDDDAGSPIVAAIKTGKLHFGSTMKKQVYDVFIGRTTTGRMVLKVQHADEGVLKEYWYELRRNTAGTHSDERIKLGRGARSVYWQFELVNPDGEDFEVEYMTPDAVKMSRRT